MSCILKQWQRGKHVLEVTVHMAPGLVASQDITAGTSIAIVES
jgi:hypothetical protein